MLFESNNGIFHYLKSKSPRGPNLRSFIGGILRDCHCRECIFHYLSEIVIRVPEAVRGVTEWLNDFKKSIRLNYKYIYLFKNIIITFQWWFLLSQWSFLSDITNSPTMFLCLCHQLYLQWPRSESRQRHLRNDNSRRDCVHTCVNGGKKENGPYTKKFFIASAGTK